MNAQTDLTGFARVSAEEVAGAAQLSAATLHEAAGQIGALPAAIKPLDAAMRVCGPAFTLKGPPGDNLWLHHAMGAATRGDVLLADVGSHYEAGYWGDVMTTQAQAQGLAGLVIDGCVRDGAEIIEAGFPVFSRGLSVRGTAKDHDFLGQLAGTIVIDGVIIEAGDLVIGDADGVVVIPRARAAEAIAAGVAREARENEGKAKLRAGAMTVDLYGWRRS